MFKMVMIIIKKAIVQYNKFILHYRKAETRCTIVYLYQNPLIPTVVYYLISLMQHTILAV